MRSSITYVGKLRQKQWCQNDHASEQNQYNNKSSHGLLDTSLLTNRSKTKDHYSKAWRVYIYWMSKFSSSIFMVHLCREYDIWISEWPLLSTYAFTFSDCKVPLCTFLIRPDRFKYNSSILLEWGAVRIVDYSLILADNIDCHAKYTQTQRA